MATGLAEGAVEAVAEAAEVVSAEAADVAQVTRAITGREMGICFFASCVGTAGGLFIGYRWAKSVLNTKYQDIANEEIEQMREHFNSKIKAYESNVEKKDLDTTIKELGYVSSDMGKRVPYEKVEPQDITEVTVQSVGPVMENIFDKAEDETEVDTPKWDYAEEVKNRDNSKPFIIHRDEFMENAWKFESTDLTYFEGDDILSDERDRVIEDQDSVIGLENMSKFGHGSNDPTMLYICNVPMNLLIKVTHSDGKYATEVHGFTEDELQHSDMRRRPPRRARYDDSD